MTLARKLSTPYLAQALLEQRQWYADQGGSRAGYVARYGSARDRDHYGSGGEAIHAADAAWLQDLEAEAVRRLTSR